MTMIRFGDKVKRRLKCYDPDLGPHETETTVEATVVYIHPQRRYVTLRYDLPGGSYCESELLTKTT